MAANPSRLVVIAAVVIACRVLPASAGDHGRLWQTIAQPFKVLHRQAPPAGCETPVDGMAREVDWLLHHLNTHGSIVAKEPDVWGQNRLTQHRYDYEEQMRRQLGMFSERTSAALRRSDQSYLGLALALQSASGNRRTAQQVAVPDVTSTSNVFNTVQGLIPSGNETGGRADPVVIARTAPMAFPQSPIGYQFDAEPVSLEPTIHLDQLSRYLTHLNQLRRVNEGDDSADSPGYSLNLVRVPVSITPGGHTQKGYGAEITFTAEPILGDDLLPTTFRSLVLNDLVDIIAPALTWCVNDAECREWAATITESDTVDEGSAPSLHSLPAPAAARRQGVMAAMQALSAKLPTIAPKSAPAVKTRRARLPIPFSQLADVSGIEQIAILIRDTHAALANDPRNQPCIDYLLVRNHLAEELESAYDFLAIDSRRDLWAELPAWNLAGLIRGRQAAELAALRCRFFSAIGPGTGGQEIELLSGPVAAADDPAGICCEAGQSHRPLCLTTTAVLAWGILVESALLNARLIADIRESATALGQPAPIGSCAGPFYGPDPAPEARQAFNDSVRTRWPIRVFALDPVREEQNVDDTFSRRREAQIAMAVAAASGRLNAQALARYTRRTELDMATVALNQTAVGFSHGNDTFGWRFYPRVQSPPTRSGLAAVAETICGPTSDADLAQRRLESGQRECTAIIVMPSFVPCIRFDSHSTWFRLTHPGVTDPSMRQAMQLSRAVQTVRQQQAACTQCAHLYNNGDAALMARKVDQIAEKLPFQTLVARVPYENTAGGFELFQTGITDLAPELIGWYGAPGIDPAGTTTLFLIGKGFSVHDTSVIAGGRTARFWPLGRDILRVEIPPGVQTLAPAGCDACEPDACTTDCSRRVFVELHLATPYGVSSSLLVPVSRRAGGDASCTLAFDSACSLALTFTTTKTAGTKVESAKMDEFFAASCDALTIRVPASFIPPAKASLRLLLRDATSGATAAVFSFDNPFFDARNSRYVIAGGDLRNFIGDTSRPATDKTLRGAVKPYLDHLLAQGQLADDGDAVPLTLSAAIVAEQQEVPIAGTVAVQATRRGKTVIEPRADDATSPVAAP
ncbi:MAG: hypothetical protein ACKOOF_08880 [Planctomycetaceae bacterium]